MVSSLPKPQCGQVRTDSRTISLIALSLRTIDEVPVSRQELSMPPTITYEQAKGFSLFMVKSVLNGRGDEIVELAKVNLIR
jgi:hypothetical protein